MSQAEGLPIIRLEVEHMKHAILHAFAQRQIVMDEQLQVALDRALNPVRIQETIDREVDRVVNEALVKELTDFFIYGQGRQHIKTIVTNSLKKWRMYE